MSDPLYDVKPHIRARAHIGSIEEYRRLHQQSLDHPDEFWAEQAQRHAAEARQQPPRPQRERPQPQARAHPPTDNGQAAQDRRRPN